jgi:hypothetical protein
VGLGLFCLMKMRRNREGKGLIDWEELFLARRDTNSAVFCFLFHHPIPVIIPIPITTPIPITPIIIPVFLVSY